MLAAALALGAIALSAFPAAAGAKKKPGAPSGTITRHSDVTLAGFGTLGSTAATCPKGTTAISGGYDSSSLLFVYESRRIGKRSWRVSAGQSGAGSSTLTAYVYCRKGQIREASSTTPLAPAGRSDATTTANCPAGMKAISGGFLVPAQSGQAVTFVAQNKLDTVSSWSVKGVRTSTPVTLAGVVNAYAYCTRTPTKGSLMSEQVAALTSATEILTSVASGRCPNPKLALGGGFITTYADRGTERGAIFVTESRLAGNGWRSSGIATGNAGLLVTLESFAYCR